MLLHYERNLICNIYNYNIFWGYFRYALHPTLPTGLCVALVHNTSRSLVANLGAANVYTLDDLKKTNLQLDTVKIIYIEGYFITHSLDVAQELVKKAQEKNIIIAFNLSGLYIFQVHINNIYI